MKSTGTNIKPEFHQPKGFLISTSLFNFVIDRVIENMIVLPDAGAELANWETLCDADHADEFASG